MLKKIGKKIVSWKQHISYTCAGVNKLGKYIYIDLEYVGILFRWKALLLR